MLNGPHIVFAAGGALGNLYPGLSIAKRLESSVPNAQITFVGDGRAVERHTVRGAGYHYVAMPGKTAPAGPIEAVRYVTDNLAAFWASRWMVREQQVSLVVGMGGPASAAMTRAAHGRGIPFLLLEQNAVATRTTRRLASSAEAVCAAFDELRPHLPVDAPLVLTGTPGRPAFERLGRSVARSPEGADEPRGERRLVIIGGAGGMRSLNEAVPQALRQLNAELDGWQVVHQTGEGQLQETEQRYNSLGTAALVVSYIDELASLLSETDLVVCRSGGAMLAELALAGAPALLVPSPDNEGGKHLANARITAAATGCPVIDEREAGPDLAAKIVDELRPLLVDSTRRAEIAAAVGGQAKPDASEKIAEIICDALFGGRSVAA